MSESGFDSFNIDEHRKSLNHGSSQDFPESVMRKARLDYEEFIESHIRNRKGFAIEVTLAKEITFEQARRARIAGFSVQLTYVAAEVEDCLARVAKRIEAGGHGVSAEVVTQTHAASMGNLARAIAEFAGVAVFENPGLARSQEDPAAMVPRLVLEARLGCVAKVADPPRWLRNALRGSPFELTA